MTSLGLGAVWIVMHQELGPGLFVHPQLCGQLYHNTDTSSWITTHNDSNSFPVTSGKKVILS